MAQPQRKHWTVEEYLAFERESEIKHEYIDGEIVAMAGASESYVLIVFNLTLALGNRLRQTPCRVYTNDMQVHIAETKYLYPDVIALCDKPQFMDESRRKLLNPALIIEVLSPSTERHDHIHKFQHYRSIASLQEYVMVSQDQYHVTQYVRQSENEWLLTDIVGQDATLKLRSVEAEIALAELYERIELTTKDEMGDEII